MNGPNKLECYVTLGCKGLLGTNILAYWAHLYVARKIKCCKYYSSHHWFHYRLYAARVLALRWIVNALWEHYMRHESSNKRTTLWEHYTLTKYRELRRHFVRKICVTFASLTSQWAETNPSNILFSLRTSVFTSPHGTMLTAYRCPYTDVRLMLDRLVSSHPSHLWQ